MLRTIVYITKKRLRFVQFNLSADACKKVKEKSIALKDEQADLHALKDIMQKERFPRTNLISCIFRHQVGVRFFLFPSHDTKEISQMVGYEAAELLPLKPEEMITRYLVLNKRPTGYADTLVAVTHKEEVTKLIGKLKKAGIEIDVLNLSTLAIFNCIQKIVLEKNKSILKGNILITYFEDNAIEIIILKKGKLAFSRGFLINESKSFNKVLISEIRHSMELFFNDLSEKKFEKIIVAGRRADLSAIACLLKERFDLPILIEKDIDIAYGLAVSGVGQMNLLSNEFISRQMRSKLKQKLVISTGLLILNLAIFGAIFWVTLNNKKAYLEKLEQRLSRLKPQAQSIQNKIEKLQMLQRQLSSQILVLDAITDLANVTSSTCTLNMLSINEEDVLVVRGQMKSLQEVLDFVIEIEKSPYFKNSHLNYSSRRKVKGREILDFEIQAELNKE